MLKEGDRHLFSLRPTPRHENGLVVLLALALCLVVSCSGAVPRDSPDVILIVVDTLRADHLTQYGYERATSTALDDFASESSLFTAAYSTSSWTQPSIASLLTGLLPAHHGVVKQGSMLPTQHVNLASVLADAGWETAGFSGNLFIGGKTGFDRGFDHFEGHDGRVLVYPDIAEMIGWVDTWLSARQPQGPSFLYFQPMNCHGPYRVPVEHRSDLLGRPPTAVFDYNDELMKSILKDGDLEARSRVEPDYLESLTDQYDTAIRYSIDSVSALLARLDREGLYDNALVIVTADHGEEVFDHGGFGHGYSLFEEVVRIPLWIKLPGQGRGSTIDVPVSLVDVLPTILDVSGLPALEDLDGRTLAPLLEGEHERGFRTRPIVMDTRWKRRAEASAVRLGSFKLIDIESDYAGRSNAQLLFDLASDPGEQSDLAMSEPGKVEALSTAMKRVLESRQAGVEAEEATNLDVEVLRALGYID